MKKRDWPFGPTCKAFSSFWLFALNQSQVCEGLCSQCVLVALKGSVLYSVCSESRVSLTELLLAGGLFVLRRKFFRLKGLFEFLSVVGLM